MQLQAVTTNHHQFAETFTSGKAKMNWEVSAGSTHRNPYSVRGYRSQRTNSEGGSHDDIAYRVVVRMVIISAISAISAISSVLTILTVTSVQPISAIFSGSSIFSWCPIISRSSISARCSVFAINAVFWLPVCRGSSLQPLNCIL